MTLEVRSVLVVPIIMNEKDPEQHGQTEVSKSR